MEHLVLLLFLLLLVNVSYYVHAMRNFPLRVPAPGSETPAAISQREVRIERLNVHREFLPAEAEIPESAIRDFVAHAIGKGLFDLDAIAVEMDATPEGGLRYKYTVRFVK